MEKFEEVEKIKNEALEEIKKCKNEALRKVSELKEKIKAELESFGEYKGYPIVQEAFAKMNRDAEELEASTDDFYQKLLEESSKSSDPPETTR